MFRYREPLDTFFNGCFQMGLSATLLDLLF